MIAQRFYVRVGGNTIARLHTITPPPIHTQTHTHTQPPPHIRKHKHTHPPTQPVLRVTRSSVSTTPFLSARTHDESDGSHTSGGIRTNASGLSATHTGSSSSKGVCMCVDVYGCGCGAYMRVVCACVLCTSAREPLSFAFGYSRTHTHVHFKRIQYTQRFEGTVCKRLGEPPTHSLTTHIHTRIYTNTQHTYALRAVARGYHGLDGEYPLSIGRGGSVSSGR